MGGAMSIVILPSANYIAGVQDDGTNEGVIRSKIINGELVRVPFIDTESTSVLAGAGSASLNRNAYSNGDHTGMAYNMSVTTAIGVDQASLCNIVYGRTVGIRFRKLSTTPAFSLVIDGVPYEVPQMQRQVFFGNQQISGLGNSKEGIFVVSDLPDTPHSVRIIVWPDGVASKTVVIYGFLAERCAGYSTHAPLDIMYGGATLTTSAVAVPITDTAGNANHGVKSIIYYNSDVATRTVTLTWNSITVAILTITAGSYNKFDFSSTGLNMGTSPNLTHQADANSVVKFVCIGSL